MTASLADLYRRMLAIRTVEERILTAQQQGLVTGSTHLCIGQEAIPVGAVEALSAQDPVIATYRGHGWVLARGATPRDFLAELMGKDSTLNGGRGGSAYLSDAAHSFYGENSIVGAGVPIALGLAIACQRRTPDHLAVVSIGDGAMNQGNVHESLNMAAVLRVPLLVVVENNGYAEMTPSSMLTAVPAAARAAAYLIPSFEVDGNDPEAVADTIAGARAEALADSHPVLVEAHTHRLAGHYSGDAQAYRPQGELERMRAQDPLIRAAARLGESEVATIRAAVTVEVEAAYNEAAASPLPPAEEATAHVYA